MEKTINFHLYSLKNLGTFLVNIPHINHHKMKSESCASMELNIFKNNSNRALTLDILYHPDETRTLDYLHDVLFSITTFLSIFTLYTVYTRSPATMGLYKYVLLNSTIWIYIGEIVLFFWRPVPAFPYLTFYSTGVFKYLSPDYLLWIVFAVLASLLGVENSFGIAFLYRISQVFFTNWFHEFVNDKKHLIAMFIGLYAFELGVLGGKKQCRRQNWPKREGGELVEYVVGPKK